MDNKTSQTLENFGKLVDDHFPQLNILNYYPYGKETQFSYWLCGRVDLKKLYLEKRNENKTELDYVHSIIEEIGRAMNYLIVSHGDWGSSFDFQRIEAFALWRLMKYGVVGWTKDPLKGLNMEQKEKLYKLHDKRYKLLSPPRRKDSSDRKLETNKKYMKLVEKGRMGNRKKYGIYEIKHFPLTQYSNSTRIPKILYNKQQLAAIDLMVTCAFENLC
jgi:hypothetical protein